MLRRTFCKLAAVLSLPSPTGQRTPTDVMSLTAAHGPITIEKADIAYDADEPLRQHRYEIVKIFSDGRDWHVVD